MICINVSVIKIKVEEKFTKNKATQIIESTWRNYNNLNKNEYRVSPFFS